MNINYQLGVCEVHKYALNDHKIRNVFYCTVCEAWICDECNNDYVLRAEAAAIRKLRRLFGKE